MNLPELIRGVNNEAKRIFPDARFVILEDLSFYHKVRIILEKDLFIEVRINSMNKRVGYALVQGGNRIAGFDNLGTWHIHPIENPKTHRKISAPVPQNVFEYFTKAVKR